MRAIMLWVLLFTTILGGNSWAGKPTAPDHVKGSIKVSAEQLIELFSMTSDLVIVDSRRVEEFNKGHIEGAYNLLDIEMTESKLKKIAPELDTPILFYCNGPRCLRSSNAVSKAVSWGYTSIYWFRGGWKIWTAEQYPVSY